MECILCNFPFLSGKYKFKCGLNIDTQKFNPNGTCTEGGLYFTKEDNILQWSEYTINRKSYKMYYIWDVRIPNNARVYTDGNKFKANRMLIEEWDEWDNPKFCFDMLKKIKRDNKRYSRSLMRYISTHMWNDQGFCESAVRLDIILLAFLSKTQQTEELCTYVFRNCMDKHMVRFLEMYTYNRSLEVKLEIIIAYQREDRLLFNSYVLHSTRHRFRCTTRY